MSKSNNSLTSLALQKFKKNIWGVFSFWVIVAIGLVSIFAYVLVPDDSKNANQMHLSIHSKSPGFKVLMLEIPNNIKDESTWLSKLFFGKNNTTTEIPISDYKIEGESLVYTEYADDGLIGQQKSIDISTFSNAEAESYIKERTFVFRDQVISY